MKYLSFLLLAAPLWLFSQQMVIVPYTVQKKFDEKFPAASIYYWEDFQRQYMAYYEIEDNFYYARLNITGQVTEEGISLDKPFAIPPLVKKVFDQETGGMLPISEAFKTKTSEGTEAFLLVGFTLKAKYEILIGKDGRLLRHEEGVVETIEGDDEEEEVETGTTPEDKEDREEENSRDPRRMDEDGEGGKIQFRDPSRKKEDE